MVCFLTPLLELSCLLAQLLELISKETRCLRYLCGPELLGEGPAEVPWLSNCFTCALVAGARCDSLASGICATQRTPFALIAQSPW